jgi:hypothetical protein
MKYLERKIASMSDALKRGPDLLSGVVEEERELKLSDLKKRIEDLVQAYQELVTHYVPDEAGGRFE